MSQTLSASLLLMLSMGFMGSLHCIGMCGGLVSAVSLSRKQVWWSGLLAYQFGRVSTYSALGLLVGASGSALSSIGGDQVQRIFAGLAGVLMIAFALNLAGWLPNPLKKLGAWASRKTGLAGMAMRVAGSGRATSWYALGLINGLLPCGLVYAALSMALAAGNTLQSALMMTAFGLGTIPAMMFVPSLMRGMTPAQRTLSLRIAAALLMLIGGMTLYRVSNPPHSMQHGMHNQHATLPVYFGSGLEKSRGLEKSSIGSTSSPSVARRPMLS